MKSVCRVAVLLSVMVIVALMGVSAQAQGKKCHIEGRVVDAAGEPIPFVNVLLRQAGALVKGTVTDDAGDYVLAGLTAGEYELAFQYMGYKPVANPFVVSGTHKLKPVTLVEDTEEIAEVAVVAQQQTMKLGIDRKIFNVDQDIASVGGAATDVLENIPSVQVDSEGNISLRGSSSVTVWINGKAQGLTSDNRGDILQQLPAESIERIEVITNPSSKYSAEGSAGIINIVLKRDRKAGYYGGVKVGVNNEGGGRMGANINYSSGVLDAYVNIGLGRRKNHNGGWTDRDYLATDEHATGFLNSTSKGKNDGLNLFGRAGVTWHMTEHDDWGVAYMGMGGGHERHSTIDYRSDNYAGETLLTGFVRRRESDSDNDMNMHNVEASYRHEWETGHTFDVTASMGRWCMDGSSTYDQKTYNMLEGDHEVGTGDLLSRYESVGSAILSYQKQKTDINNKWRSVRADYERPVGDASKLEAGYEGNYHDENSPTETFSDEAMTVSVEGLFNRFKYRSKVHAGYANWNSQVSEVFGYQLGLRGEGWKVETESWDFMAEYGYSSTGKDGGTVDTFEKRYFELFPTAYLSFKVGETNEIQLNYTRRLQRPWGGQMNSFKNITDSTSISYGNPLLTPEFTNSLELNYIKTWENHTLSFSGYYRPSTDVIQNISYMEGGVRFQTNENIAKSLSSGLEIIVKNRLWGALDVTTTLNAFYYKLEGGDFEKTTDSGNKVKVNVPNAEDFSWNGRVMASLMLPREIIWQSTFSFSAPKVIAQGEQLASYSLDMGVKKTMFDKKLTLAVNGRDLLESRRSHTKTQSSGYRQESESWRGGRRIMLQVAWNFGNMQAKKEKSVREMSGGYESSEE